MRKLLLLAFIFTISVINAQESAYGAGEFLKFRVHYGLITAGYSTLQVKDATINGKNVFHVKGYGETTGVTSWVFGVEDDYQTYIDKQTNEPQRFIRKIDEGGHTKDIQIDYNHSTNKATVFDKKHDTKEVFSFPDDAQDMVSSFYYLRNKLDTKNLKVGQTVDMNMFYDKENYKFRIKFLGRETLKTTFGKVSCLIFRPYVEAGRVFKEQESLTLWVSDDENKIPMLIKADLAVGSLKATLIEFKGLKHQFKIIAD